MLQQPKPAAVDRTSRYHFWGLWFLLWIGYALFNSIVAAVQEKQPWLRQGMEELLSYSLLCLLGIPECTG